MLQRLKSFIAEADIRGFLKEVEYDHRLCTLVIRNVTSPDEAATLLDFLSDGTVTGAKVSSLTSISHRAAKKEASNEEADPVLIDPNQSLVSKSEPKSAPKSEPESEPESEPKSEPESESETKRESKPTTPAAKKRRRSNKSTVQQDILEPKESLQLSKTIDTPQKQLQSGIPSAVENAGMMREVLNYIFQNETENPDEIKKRCIELKELGLKLFARIDTEKLLERANRCLVTMEVITDLG